MYAGQVSDFTGWLDQVKNHTFQDFITLKNFHSKSLYELTQFHTFILYTLFGANAISWHLVHITLQAVNAVLLFTFFRSVFTDSGINHATAIAAWGTMLFCICPQMSEVIVWEPSFHYLQGLLFILLILTWTRAYLLTSHTKYAWWSIIAFFLSTYTMEIFYLTPWLVASLILYYRYAVSSPASNSNKALRYIFLPVLSIFIVYLVEYRIIFGEWIAHIGSGTVANLNISGFGKPAKYLFNILFLGRFFEGQKLRVYAFLDTPTAVICFYSLVILLLGFMAIRFRKANPTFKAASLLVTWVMLTLLILIPLWFQDLFIVLCDRYTYFTSAFLYILVALLFSSIKNKYLSIAVIGIYALVNIRFTIQANRFWMKSARVVNNLLHTFPDPGNKVVLLLNLPQNMKGIPMITATPEGEFNLMLHLFEPGKKITTPVIDVASFNTLSPEDGAHVSVITDSTIRVTENQWGTWWWYNNQGCTSYANNYYTLETHDGHFYDLTLKLPHEKYLLLYQAGGYWKEVNFSRKEDQY